MPNHNAVPDPEQVDKELKVLELRRMGMTWQRIAEQTGYADHSGAYLAYKRAIKRTLQPVVDEVRDMELDRLDRLQMALWPKAMQGSERSVLAIVRVMEHRAALLGLKKPTQMELEVTNANGATIRDNAQRIVEIIRQHRELESGTEEGGVGSNDGESGAAPDGE